MVLLGVCLVFSSSMAQDQVVNMETARPEGSKMTLLVNASHQGLSIDWGDGNVVEYAGNPDGGLMEIEGTVKGKSITVTGNKKWKILDCSNCDLKRFSMKNAVFLKSVNCSHNNLKGLVLRNLPKLVDLNCSYNQIGNVVFSSPDKSKVKEDLPLLKNLNFSHNNLSSTFNWNIPTLDNLNISNNKIKLFYSFGAHLKQINCSNNNLKSTLDLQEQTNLENLLCYNNSFDELVLFNNGEHIQQLVCDNNLLSAISLQKADSLQDISCTNNSLKKVSLPQATRLVSYNASDNSLDFSSLPGRPLQYVGFNTQQPFEVTNIKGVLQKDGVNYLPFSEDWNSMNLVHFDEQVTMADGSADVTSKWYTVTSDNTVKEMTQRTSSSGTGDFYADGSQFAFFAPQKKAYVTFTSKVYGCTIQSQPFAIGDDVTGIVQMSDGQNCLQILVSRGILTAQGTGKLRICTPSGKCMWQGQVHEVQNITLPQGIYVVNNMKVVL